MSSGPDLDGRGAARGNGAIEDRSGAPPARRRAEGRITSVRQLGGRVRRRLSRHPLAETGFTVAGDAVLPPAAGDGGGASVPTGSEAAVRTEGAAAVGEAARGAAVTVWFFAPEREPAEVPLTDVARLVANDENFVWIDLSGYAEADLRAVADALGLPRAAVRAALSPWQRPRLAVYPAHFFASATVPHLDTAAYRIDAAELDLVVGRNLFVSAHKAPLPFAEHLRARATGSPELVQLDAAFMIYIALDELLSYYEELNRRVQA